MMVLDLRSFDIVEGVGFNELFILVTNPFPNPNSFGNSDSFENSGFSKNPDKFENPDLEEISYSRPDLIFRVLAHLYVISVFFHKIKRRLHGWFLT